MRAAHQRATTNTRVLLASDGLTLVVLLPGATLRFVTWLRIEASVGSVPNGEAGRATPVQFCSGISPTPEANALIQWEHDNNRLVGNRYRILAVLNVRVWL